MMSETKRDTYKDCELMNATDPFMITPTSTQLVISRFYASFELATVISLKVTWPDLPRKALRQQRREASLF